MEALKCGCEFCNNQDMSSGGAHDFRILGKTLYYNDYSFGWEGMEIDYCPMCGKKLEGK